MTIRQQGAAAGANVGAQQPRTTKQLGDAAETAALQHLQRQGLRLLQRNFRTPGRGGGEIDLIMCDRDGTLVFVEVRRRRNNRHGGAAATVGSVKQRRLVFAARHYLSRLPQWPPCRFDVVTVTADAGSAWQLEWLPAAFDAGA